MQCTIHQIDGNVESKGLSHTNFSYPTLTACVKRQFDLFFNIYQIIININLVCFQGTVNDGPPKPPMRATWAGDESIETNQNQTPKRKPPQRRITVVGINASEDPQSQPETGGHCSEGFIQASHYYTVTEWVLLTDH